MINALGTLGESSGVALCSIELSLRCVTEKNARAAVETSGTPAPPQRRRAMLGSLRWPDRVQPPRLRLGF